MVTVSLFKESDQRERIKQEKAYFHSYKQKTIKTKGKRERERGREGRKTDKRSKFVSLIPFLSFFLLNKDLRFFGKIFLIQFEEEMSRSVKDFECSIPFYKFYQ